MLAYGALISVVILFKQDRRPHWVIENINLAPQSEPTPPSASFTEPTVRPPRTRRRPPTPQSPPGAARALWPPIDAAHACSELGWAPRARAQTSTQDGRGQRLRVVENFEKVASCACVQRNCYVRESFARFGRKLSQFSSEIWATFWRNSCHRQFAARGSSGNFGARSAGGTPARRGRGLRRRAGRARWLYGGARPPAAHELKLVNSRRSARSAPRSRPPTVHAGSGRAHELARAQATLRARLRAKP